MKGHLNLQLIKSCFMLLIFFGFAEISNAQYTLTDNDVVVENGIITICSYDFSEKNIVIPEILDGQTVTGIADSKSGDDAIFGYKQISSLQLPSSITTLGNYAFINNSIDTLDLSQCTALTYIGDFAFQDNEIDTLDLSQCTALTYIGKNAFEGNLLSAFKLPTPSFSGYTFKIWNTYLEGGDVVSTCCISYIAQGSYTLSDDDVVVENGIITRYNTGYCITDLTIPETLDGQTVTGIANGAPGIFADKQISSLQLPSAITTIGNDAFTNNNIDTLDLSQFTALTYIGDRAFFNNGLTNFTLPTPAISGYIFNNWQNTEGTIYNGGRAVSNFETAYTARLNSIDVTITVTNGTNAIEGATVTFNNTEYTSNTEGNVTIIGVSDGDHPYTATADGYETVNGTVTVAGEDLAETVLLNSIDVTITVTNGTNAIEGATVTFNDTEYTSNTEGNVTIIAVGDGDYPYTAAANGYETANGTITVAGEDLAETVLLNNTDVTITVTNGSNAIEGATVTFNNIEYTSNAEGKVTITSVSNGNYPFTATADGYETANGTITVAGGDVDEIIALGKTTAIENSVSESFVAYPNPASDYIYIKNANGLSAIALYNTFGQQVLQVSGVKYIDVSTLKNGLYTLQCTINGKIHISHIVIE